jgi:hypothetical protein
MPPTRRSSFSPAAMFSGMANAVKSIVTGGDDMSNESESSESEEVQNEVGVQTRGAKAAREASELVKASTDATKDLKTTPRAKRAAPVTPSESLIARAARVKAADLARVANKSRQIAEQARRREEQLLRDAAKKAADEERLAVLAAVAEAESSSCFPAAGGPEAGANESIQSLHFPDVEEPEQDAQSSISGASHVSARTEADPFMDEMTAVGLTGVARVLRDEVGICSLAELATYSVGEVVEWLREAGKTIRPGTPMAKKLAKVTISPENFLPEKVAEAKVEARAPAPSAPEKDEDDIVLPKKKPSKSRGKVKAEPLQTRVPAWGPGAAAAFAPGEASTSRGETLRDLFNAEIEPEKMEQVDPTIWMQSVENCPLLSGVVEHFFEHERTSEQVSDFCFSLLGMFKVEPCEDNVEIIALQIEAELERILAAGGSALPEEKRGSKALRAHLALAHARLRNGELEKPVKPTNEKSQSSQAQAAAMGAAVAASRLMQAGASEPSEGKQSSAKSLAAERARERVRAVAQDDAAREALLGLSTLGQKAEPKEFLRRWNEVNRAHVKTAELLHTERLTLAPC